MEHQQQLLSTAARELRGVSVGYLSSDPLLRTARRIVDREPCSEVDRETLWLALSSDAYRRWLGAKLLDDFYRRLRG
jgi:hypothetical protein